MTDRSSFTAAKQPHVRKFNPGLLETDDEVAEQFVVRENEFGTACEVIRGNIKSPSCQHVLLLGSRGQGKTMLLRRIAAEVRMDRELSRQFLPVQFMEENEEVDTLADFWMETLFQLAKELKTKNNALSEELTATHASLSARWREQAFEELARSAVLEASDRMRLRLVLLVENVQSLFSAGGEEFGWGLRKTLQTRPQITLVASATSRFEALDDPQAPFFELFRFIEMKPLNTEECGRLWSTVSEATLNRQEIRPLEILTGGNPRLIVVVASFARHSSLRQLMEELVVLVDEHTDYFRSHLEALPRQERRVFVALIDLWQPSSASEIAARARLDIRVVSTMLKRLIDRGAATSVGGSGNRNRLYITSERLFSVYYKLRREQNESAVVESLIHFMVSFYELNALNSVSEQLLIDAVESTSKHAGVESALWNRVHANESGLKLKWGTIAAASKKLNDSLLENARIRLIDGVMKASEVKDWNALLDATEQYVSDGFLSKGNSQDQDLSWSIVSRARSVAYLGINEFDQVINIGVEASSRLEGTADVALLQDLCVIKSNQAWAHFELGDCVRVTRECGWIAQRFSEIDEADVIALVVFAHILNSAAEEKLGNTTASLSSLEEVIMKYGESDEARLLQPIALASYRRSDLLSRSVSDIHRAIRSLDEFLVRYEGTDDLAIRGCLISAMRKQGVNYGMIGEFKREIDLFESVIERVKARDGTYLQACLFISLLQKGRRLAELGESAAALATCDDAERWLYRNVGLLPNAKTQGLDWYANCTRALAMMKLGDSDGALIAFRTAYSAFDIDRRSDFEELMRLVAELLAAGAREEDLTTVLRCNDDSAWNLLPLIISLQRRIGVEVRAPLEALKVAEDVETCINHRLTNGLQPGYFLRLSYD